MNDALQIQIQAMAEQILSLQQALEDARRENTLLHQKLDALARRCFGKQSEALDAAQLQLLLSGLTQKAEQPAPQESLLPLAPVQRRARPHPTHPHARQSGSGA
jgi:hypothetical protein